MSRRTCPRSLLLVLAVLARSALALEFDMMFQTKCVMEEINEGVLVVGDYSGVSKSDYTTPVALDVKVEDPRGRQIFEKKKETSGQFAFTSKASGDYKACFTAKDVQTALNTKLRLDWRTGVAATDWDAIAKKDHLDELRMELLKLEEMAKDIHTEMLHLRKREEEMRDLNEETNERVAWFSIASLFICVGLALWQLWYLRRFFHRKKLL